MKEDEENGLDQLGVVILTTLLADETSNKIGMTKGIDIMKLRTPGTLIWTDPITKETRYTPSGDRLYSIALMFAEKYINAEGKEVNWGDFDE